MIDAIEVIDAIAVIDAIVFLYRTLDTICAVDFMDAFLLLSLFFS